MSRSPQPRLDGGPGKAQRVGLNGQGAVATLRPNSELPSLRSPRLIRGASSLLAFACALAAGCGRDAATASPPPVDVKVITVATAPTEIFRDLVGEVRGSQEVEIRARVNGILTGKHFADGAMVDEGQLLYTIDAREYRAQVATADANLASAEANLARARQDVERYEPLLAENAISQQVYDNAVAAAKEAEAQVRANSRRDHRGAARRGVRRSARTDDRADRRFTGIRGRTDQRGADTPRDDLRRRSRLG